MAPPYTTPTPSRPYHPPVVPIHVTRPPSRPQPPYRYPQPRPASAWRQPRPAPVSSWPQHRWGSYDWRPSDNWSPTYEQTSYDQPSYGQAPWQGSSYASYALVLYYAPGQAYYEVPSARFWQLDEAQRAAEVMNEWLRYWHPEWGTIYASYEPTRRWPAFPLDLWGQRSSYEYRG